MKLIRPGNNAGESGNSPPRLHRIHVPARIPQWLQHRIDDRGEFVLLSCGHKDNLNDRSLLLIATLGKDVQVMCERCQSFAAVVRHMRGREYFGIPRDESDIPLF